jgi:hypothetical protein
METEGKDIAIGKLNYPTILLVRNSSRGGHAAEMAERTARSYEEKARRIAHRHSSELELLTAQLCSSG